MNSGGYVEIRDVMYFLKETLLTPNKEYTILDVFPGRKNNIDSWNEIIGSIAQVVLWFISIAMIQL